MAARYRRVNQQEAGEEEFKKIRAERADRISAKLHALVWVIVAVALIYFTDFFDLICSDKLNRYFIYMHVLTSFTLFSHPAPSFLILRFALNLAIVCLFSNIGIFLYLTVYLPYILKVTAPWDIYCPNMIPISTMLGVAFTLCFMLAFWPVWGILTPLYVAILLVGLIFSAHFVPWPC